MLAPTSLLPQLLFLRLLQPQPNRRPTPVSHALIHTLTQFQLFHPLPSSCALPLPPTPSFCAPYLRCSRAHIFEPHIVAAPLLLLRSGPSFPSLPKLRCKLHFEFVIFLSRHSHTCVAEIMSSPFLGVAKLATLPMSRMASARASSVCSQAHFTAEKADDKS